MIPSINGDPFNPAKIAIEGIPKTNQRYTVPVKTHIPIVSVILITIAGAIGALGIAQMAGFLGSVGTLITSYISSISAWNPLWMQMIIAVVLVVLSLLIYKTSGSVTRYSNQIRSVFTANIEKKPTAHVQMSFLPPESLVGELQNRNCKVTTENNELVIRCPSFPYTQEQRDLLLGRYDGITFGLHITIVVFLNIICALPLFFFLDGSLDYIYGPWLWYFLLIFFIFILAESNLLPLWALVGMYILHTILATIFVPEILLIVSIGVPGGIIFFGFAIILYFLKGDHCTKQSSWYCDRL